jgi:acyl-coA thioester hydrolase ybgC
MFFSSGLDFDENRLFVVVNINANFIKPAVLGDLLEVRSQVVQIKKASITLRQEIYKIGRLSEACEPKLIFSCDVVLAFLNRSKVAKIDEETAKIFKTNEKF